jgi:protein SCO1
MMRSPYRFAVPAVALALVVALAIALILGDSPGPSPAPAPSSSASASSGFDGAALAGEERPRDFTLADQSGQRVSLRSYRGRVTILAFLYSTCGPTCILIAQQIRGALDELPRPAPVLIVSADPNADTPARVRRFLARVSLTGRVRYLTGSLSALEPIWRAYRTVPASSGSAAFDRAATVLLLDSSGRERVLFGLEQLTPEGLAHDIRKLS